MKKHTTGFSVIEVMLAAALFVIFASGMAGLVISGLQSNRLGAEQVIATAYATEGIEALKSIKNQSFAALTTTAATGITRTSNVWTLSGVNNALEKYTRVLSISDVQRDGSGNIVVAGGTLDSSTKKITSTVTWNVTPTRANSVVLSSYVTNWKAAIGRGGMLVYGDGGTTTDAIKYKVLGSDSTWSAAANTADVDSGTTNRALRVARLYASTNSNQKILLSRHYNGTTQYIYAQVFDGTNWGNVQLLSSWNATTFLDAKNFDGTYLANGDFMVVYSDNTTQAKFRVWNGSSWSAAANTTVTLGIPTKIVTRARPGTNEVILATFGQTRNSTTQNFNGGAYTAANWSAVVNHGTASTNNTKEMIDFLWSPVSTNIGALVYSNNNADNSMQARIWTASGNGAGIWGSPVQTAVTSALGSLTMTARSAAFLACNQDTGLDINCFETTFAPLWNSPTNRALTVNTIAGNQRAFDIAYEENGYNTAVAVYSDNTTTAKLKKYTASTTTFDAAATNVGTLGGVLASAELVTEPGTNEIIAVMADANRALYTIFWDGTNDVLYNTPASKALTTHGTNGSASTEYWYDFVWDGS